MQYTWITWHQRVPDSGDQILNRDPIARQDKFELEGTRTSGIQKGCDQLRSTRENKLGRTFPNTLNFFGSLLVRKHGLNVTSEISILGALVPLRASIDVVVTSLHYCTVWCGKEINPLHHRCHSFSSDSLPSHVTFQQGVHVYSGSATATAQPTLPRPLFCHAVVCESNIVPWILQNRHYSSPLHGAPTTPVCYRRTSVVSSSTVGFVRSYRYCILGSRGLVL